MGELIERNFANKSVDPIKEFHKKYRRKFDPEMDVLLLLSQVKVDKFDILLDDLFKTVIRQDSNRLNRIIKDNDPCDLLEIIEGESFLKSIAPLLDDRGTMKDMNKGIKKFLKNFKRRLHRKIIKNLPERI